MSDPVDIYVTAPLVPRIEAQLRSRYTVHRGGAGQVPPDVASKVRALVPSGAAPASLIAQLPKLEIITSVSVGYEAIDVALAASRGIPVTNTPDVLNDDVADLAIALMIMASRRLAASEKYLRDGKWPSGSYPLARKASGKKLGILGLGRIGRAIAKRAEAMDMEISYTNRKPAEGSYRFMPDLVELARQNDFLVVAASAGPDALHLVNAEVLKALGPDGIVVNIARGRVIDEKAMVAALTDGTLGGAGLDVFEDEPNVPAALMGLENVALLPHVGSATLETRDAMGQLALDNLDAFFAGKPLLSEVLETQAARVTR